jgi:hypothetical protein
VVFEGERVRKMKRLDVKRTTVMMLIFILGSFTTAYAVAIEATITADNHYALYFGATNGSFVTFVGRNELGSGGSPGSYNWSQAESFTFDITTGDCIYIAAWSDDATAQGLIGQFVIPDWGATILTNTSDWEVYLTFNDLDDGSEAPTESELGSEISSASWNIVTDYIAHGSSPWGYIAGISSEADWIWGSALTPGSDYGEYQIFRTKVVPEPATVLLLGIGGAIFLRRYRN